MQTVEAAKPMLRKLKSELQQIYQQRFRRMILYGSFARDEAHEGSDIDVLLVLSQVRDPLAERESLSDVIWELALEHSVVLSVLPVDEKAFETRQMPLFLNVRREEIEI